MKRLVHTLSLLAAVALVQAPAAVHACGVCMGQSNDSSFAGAMNGAIFVMLGFIGAMLAGISAVGYTLYRRSQSVPPDHVHLAEMIGSPTHR